PFHGLLGLYGVFYRKPQIIRHRDKIILREGGGTAHQLEMSIPKLLGSPRVFDEIRGPARQLAPRDRPMPEHITEPIAELIADLRDLFVGRAAIRAVVTAVFDQRNRRVWRAEHVIVIRIYRPIEAIIRTLHISPPRPSFSSAVLIMSDHARTKAPRLHHAAGEAGKPASPATFSANA